MPGLVPGICVLRRRKSRHCERSEAIHPSVMPRDGLLRCARNDDERFSHNSVTLELASDVARFARSMRKNFFIIFVDGIFTTFIARLFTNTSDAIRENPAMSCV